MYQGSKNVVNPMDPDLKQALLIIKVSFVYNMKLTKIRMVLFGFR